MPFLLFNVPLSFFLVYRITSHPVFSGISQRKVRKSIWVCYKPSRLWQLFNICPFVVLDRAGGWDDTGCSVVHATPEYTTCTCNHLTSFAILLVFLCNVSNLEKHSNLTN